MKTFVLINVAAGFLHYLFQVLASHRLSADAFAGFSTWLAYLSFAWTGASVLQYLSCFLPLDKKRMRLFLLVSAIYAALVCALPLALGFDGLILGGSAAMMALVFALFAGQVQVRMFFTVLATANLLFGLSKLVLALLPLWPAGGMEVFAGALVYSYIPALILLGGALFYSVRLEAPPSHSRPLGGAILSTFILGAASSLIPQFELMLMEATQPHAVYIIFARLSLFYKGIFFMFLIFSQWLLPHQLRQEGLVTPKLFDMRLAAAAFLLAAIAALAGPPAATYILAWAEAPPALLIFLACLNMALLTWVFLLLQEICARQNLKAAALLLAGLFAVVPVQLVLKLPVERYYFVAILWNSILVWRSVTCAGEGRPKSSSL